MSWELKYLTDNNGDQKKGLILKIEQNVINTNFVYSPETFNFFWKQLLLCINKK